MPRHSQAVRTGIANYVASTFDDAGTPGSLVFLTMGGVVVASLQLSEKACKDAMMGAAVFNTISPDTNAVGGDMAKVSVRNGNGVEKSSGTITVKGEGGDLQVKTLTVSPGQTVRCPSFQYVAPL